MSKLAPFWIIRGLSKSKQRVVTGSCDKFRSIFRYISFTDYPGVYSHHGILCPRDASVHRDGQQFHSSPDHGCVIELRLTRRLVQKSANCSDLEVNIEVSTINTFIFCWKEFCTRDGRWHAAHRMINTKSNELCQIYPFACEIDPQLFLAADP